MPARALAAVLIAFVALPAAAQNLRNFNASALRGELVVGQPPNVELNGKAARLAPGARIRGENNLVLMSATLTGQRLVVNYTVDPGGLLMDVWILTPEERARKPWPTTAKQAQEWNFDVNAQAWTKP